MPFDWKEYKEIADRLKDQGDSELYAEASYRSAVSRYYYAAFCHARNYARDGINVHVPIYVPSYSGDDHRGVIEHYRRNVRIFRNTHANLARLLELRGKCDYEDDVQEPSNKAAISASLAQKIIGNLP